MLYKFQIVIILFLAILINSCSSPSVQTYKLTEDEKQICDSIGFDASVIQSIRSYSLSKIERFHYSLSKIIKIDTIIEADPIFLKGIVFQEENSKSYDLVFNLKDKLKQKGYTVFLLENNFNIGGKLDYVSVLKTTDKFNV